MADDDDDYGFGDLDDEDFSAIDAIESNYLQSTQSLPQPSAPVPLQFSRPTLVSVPVPSAAAPASKRQRPENWKPAPPRISVNKPTITAKFTPSEWDNPDIDFVPRADGSYGLADQGNEPTSKIPTPITRPPEQNNSGSVAQKPGFKPPLPTTTSANISRAGSSLSQSTYSLKAPRGNNQGRSPSPLVIRPSPPAVTVRGSQGGLRTPLEASSPGAGPSKPRSSAAAVPTSTSDVLQLQAQLEELRRRTEELEESLRNARDETMMKNGEASNMKRAMEKQAKLHADAIDKLKEERDAKVEAVLKVQQDLQSDIDGLKAQLAFQKHETELGKWSVKRKSNARMPMSQISSTATPRRLPAMSFNADAWGQTPQRRAFGSPAKGQRLPSPVKLASQRTWSPSKQGAVGRSKNSENIKPNEEPQFSGFYNSFARPSSPVKKRDKGKAKEAASSPTKSDIQEDNDAHMQHPASDGPSDIFDERDTPRAASLMKTEDQQPAEPPPEQWRPDWRRELHNLLFTHCTMEVAQPSGMEPELTLQVLVGTTLPASVPEFASSSFRQGCALVLSAFGHHPRDEGWWDTVHDVAKGLVTCLHVLATHSLLFPVACLLRLIDNILVLFPQTSPEFLSAHPDAVVPPESLVGVLSNLVRTQLCPSAPDVKQKYTNPPADLDPIKTALAKGLVDVMEDLAWTATNSNASLLSPFVDAESALSYLIIPSQPLWLLTRALRLASILATHRGLFQRLVRLENSKPLDPAATPITRSISRLLANPPRWAGHPETLKISEHILCTLGTLSSVADDGGSALTESFWVIPSLVAFLSRISALIYEEDELLLSLPQEKQMSFVQSLYPPIDLLWHLVKPWNPVVDLRLKILESSARDHLQFNGLHHLFMLTFGRLSYADPPDWLPDSARPLMLKAQDLARDLLDIVVEGPESDAIWETFQDAEGGSNPGIDADEEELAREQMAMQIDEEET